MLKLYVAHKKVEKHCSTTFFLTKIKLTRRWFLRIFLFYWSSSSSRCKSFESFNSANKITKYTTVSRCLQGKFSTTTTTSTRGSTRTLNLKVENLNQDHVLILLLLYLLTVSKISLCDLLGFSPSFFPPRKQIKVYNTSYFVDSDRRCEDAFVTLATSCTRKTVWSE